MQIIFVRHGESEANKLNKNEYTICTGQFDTPLSELGIKQISKLRDNEIFEKFDKLYSSDLIRAYDTALAITSSESIVVDKRLRERSLGAFEGQLVKELKIHPEYSKYFYDEELKHFAHSFVVKAPGGENYADVENRVRLFWEEIKDKNYNKIVIVAHLYTIRVFFKILFNISEEECINYKINNAEPLVVNI